jgi:hypothetical protein
LGTQILAKLGSGSQFFGNRKDHDVRIHFIGNELEMLARTDGIGQDLCLCVIFCQAIDVMFQRIERR